jgi:hypothetical protein
VNREVIITALFNKLVSPPLVFDFTASTTTGSTTLTSVSDTSGLMVGMPVIGDGLPADATITAITPDVTISLPAIADRTASAMTQGFQTIARRLADPRAEQDMPALYLVETDEVHPSASVGSPALIELNCVLLIYTKVGADRNAVPAATLNMLLDGIERALYPIPRTLWQNLGVKGVRDVRIIGEVMKDPGHDGEVAGAVVPIRIIVSQGEDNYLGA